MTTVFDTNVKFSSGRSLTDAIEHLEAIGKGSGTHKVTVGLEAALEAAFMETQSVVHVITGSLKLSGRTSSDFDGSNWTGTITYGGPSAGPNNPVDYAIYEMQRGGAHDFMAGIPMFESNFDEAIAHLFDDV